MSMAYNKLLILGRNLERGVEYEPEFILRVVSAIDQSLRWTPVSDFFKLFPPIKRYNQQDIWDYESTLKLINNELGERFTGDDFKTLLMTWCYENPFVHNVGVAFMEAISDMNKKRTGKSVMEQFFSEQGITITEG